MACWPVHLARLQDARTTIAAQGRTLVHGVEVKALEAKYDKVKEGALFALD